MIVKIHQASTNVLQHANELLQAHQAVRAAPGSEDTELGVLMEQEVRHEEKAVYAGVQA